LVSPSQLRSSLQPCGGSSERPPKARFHLTGIFRLLLEAVFFGSAAAALAATGATRLAIVFAVIVAANIAILNAVDHG
jgi:hypothetical protein